MATDTPPLPDEGALYDGAACGLLLTDPSGVILKANLTFCRWLGLQRDDVCGTHFEKLLTTGGRIFHQTHFYPLLQLQGSIAEVKLELLSATGERMPVLVNAVRRDGGAEVWHEMAVFMARDRHAYEKELLHARKQAEQLASAKLAAEQAAQDRGYLAEQMIGIVSHDLRNPLFTIMLGAASLQRSNLDDQAKSYLGHITEAAQRAERLVEDLLDFTAARIGHGIAIECKPIDLHAVVAKCVEGLRIRWPGHVLHHLSTGTGTCLGDSRRLFQVIGNLVGNAVAYGDASSPIEVTSCISERECSISVHNQGQPIPPEHLSTLFQAMVRGTDEPTPSRSVGLGLYIVGEIARAHDGTVTVSSSREAGTTFTFAFRGDVESGQQADARAAPAGT
ncbi:MAG: PAS domain-containing sensor histidine kinase [Pseudomonadota bacterium]